MTEGRSRFLAAEQFTLWTLAATVCLYSVGRISVAYKHIALSIPLLPSETQWQDRVFDGGLGVLNLLLQAVVAPSRAHLAWILALAGFALLIALARRFERRPRARLALHAASAAAFVAGLIFMGMTWGRLQAQAAREPRAVGEHLVFAPEVAAALPKSILAENDRNALRVVWTTSEFVVVLGEDLRTVYALNAKDVALREIRPRALQPDATARSALSSPDPASGR
jgi:fructose-specific component phosphotransferase system IIB-like protein